MIDALQIWEQLADSAECRDAVNYYSCKYCYISDNKRKKEILKQGAADFDIKYCANDEYEKEHYRTDYYVGEYGYMNMHLRQNLAAFRQCFNKEEIPQLRLLVDFGCGPMTAGLALAEILSEQSPDYKTHTAYLGVDASLNMVDKAQNINDKYELFKHFKVVQGTQFDSQEIPASFPSPKIVVLCFSFVLAPDTFQPEVGMENVPEKLANNWKEYVKTQQECEETRIIYLNPLSTYFHDNWKRFKKTILLQNASEEFCYTADEKYTSLMGTYYWSIHGIRK